MFRRTAARLLGAVGVLLAVSVVIFVAVEALPGDPATRILGQNATPARLAALRDELGLRRSLLARYLSWLGRAIHGDFGEAATSDRSVWGTIATPLLNTAILAACSFVAIAIVAVVGGVISGRRPGSRIDRVVSGVALGVISLPEFVIAGLLISVFAFRLGWFSSVSLVPLGGNPLDRPSILVLPVATAAAFGGMFGLRLVRAAVAVAVSMPHVDAARVAGLPGHVVMRRHLLPTVAAPIAQVLAFLVPYLVGGTVVIERVFAYPGLGSSLVAQITERDVKVVEAISMIMAAVVVVAFVVADTLGSQHQRHLRPDVAT